MKSPFGRVPDMTHCLVACLGLLAATSALAQSASPLSLREAESLALTAEPGEEALRAKAAALAEHGTVASELPDPMLRVGLNNYPIESGSFSTEGMTQASVGFRQVFPGGDKRRLSAQRYEFLSDGMRDQANARGRDVRAAARTTWLELFYLDQADDLISEARPFFSDLATITRSLYAVGRKTQQDVLRAELELSRLDDRLVDIERRRRQARAALAEWIGQDADRPIAPDWPQWDAIPPLDDLRAALSSHPIMRSADSRVRATDTGVDIADQRRKADWTLDLAYGYRSGDLPSGDPRSDMITVGVTIGLPSLRRRSVDGSLSAALQERSAARSSRERLDREMDRRLRSEYAQWDELSHRLELYETRILVQSKDQARAALLAYQSDAGDFAEVMRAYIDDLNFRIEHVRLKVERAQSYAALANLGGLEQ